MLKHWLLVALAVFGLLAVDLYASPPDPGGQMVSTAITPNSTFLTGGTIERSTVPAFEAFTIARGAAYLAVGIVGVGLLAILFALTLSPLFIGQSANGPSRYFNTGPASPVPDRYDKAEVGEMFGDYLGKFKQTKSPVLKSHSA